MQAEHVDQHVTHAELATDPVSGCPMAMNPWLSWSRSQGAALAVRDASGPVGCDVERLRRIDALAMVKTVGAGSEISFLSGLEEPARTRAFFRMWTAKEAVLKAMGEGFRFDARRVVVPSELLDGSAREMLVSVAERSWELRLEILSDCQIAIARQMRI